MAVFIALYRGINVGGKNSVKMDALRAMHERLGHREVQSYIQSGNIVFRATSTARSIPDQIGSAFLAEFGFASKVIAVESKHWGKIIANNPYTAHASENPKTVHVGICEGSPGEKGLKALLTKTGGQEKFKVEGEVVYLHAPDGVGKSKFAAGMEKAAGVPMTVRNWRTMEALWEMAQAPS